MFLGCFFPHNNCQLDDNPYLVTGPFIMWMLRVLGDDVLPFFRQGKTEMRKKKLQPPQALQPDVLKRWPEPTISCQKLDGRDLLTQSWSWIPNCELHGLPVLGHRHILGLVTGCHYGSLCCTGDPPSAAQDVTGSWAWRDQGETGRILLSRDTACNLTNSNLGMPAMGR